eukprot:m.176128 g.176128  ORF g.176128 m.176128 type:complete len:130 (+) comp17361_c1_seq2:226-615(+)
MQGVAQGKKQSLFNTSGVINNEQSQVIAPSELKSHCTCVLHHWVAAGCGGPGMVMLGGPAGRTCMRCGIPEGIIWPGMTVKGGICAKPGGGAASEGGGGAAYIMPGCPPNMPKGRISCGGCWPGAPGGS